MLRVFNTMSIMIMAVLAGWLLGCHNKPSATTPVTPLIPATSQVIPSKTLQGSMSIQNHDIYNYLLKASFSCDQANLMNLGAGKCSCYKANPEISLKLSANHINVSELHIHPIGSQFGCNGQRLPPITLTSATDLTFIDEDDSHKGWEVRFQMTQNNSAFYILRCERCRLQNGKIKLNSLHELHFYNQTDINNAIGYIDIHP